MPPSPSHASLPSPTLKPTFPTHLPFLPPARPSCPSTRLSIRDPARRRPPSRVPPSWPRGPGPQAPHSHSSLWKLSARPGPTPGLTPAARPTRHCLLGAAGPCFRGLAGRGLHSRGRPVLPLHAPRGPVGSPRARGETSAPPFPCGQRHAVRHCGGATRTWPPRASLSGLEAPHPSRAAESPALSSNNPHM